MTRDQTHMPSRAIVAGVAIGGVLALVAAMIAATLALAFGIPAAVDIIAAVYGG